MKKLINKLKIRFYNFMMTYCMECWETARMEYDEGHKKCTRWIKKYDKYSDKLHNVPIN